MEFRPRRLLLELRLLSRGYGLTWDTSNLVDVLHDVLATRLEVSEEGNSIRNGLNILELELDADGMGNGDQVQDSVG